MRTPLWLLASKQARYLRNNLWSMILSDLTDDQLAMIEYEAEPLREALQDLEKHVSARRRIAALEQVDGRTPEEAESYLNMARQMREALGLRSTTLRQLGLKKMTRQHMERAIVDACLRRPDLRYGPEDLSLSGRGLAGYCYIATMTLCLLDPSCTAWRLDVYPGLNPPGTHFFNKRGEQVVDLTASQFPEPPDYAAARRVRVRKTARVVALLEEAQRGD